MSTTTTTALSTDDEAAEPRRTSPRRHLGIAIGTLVAAVLLAGCGDTAQNALQPEGPWSRITYDLVKPVFYVAFAVFAFVQGLVIYCILRFRKKSDDDNPVQVHGSTKFEIAWTIIPALMMLYVGVSTVSTVFKLDRTPKGSMVVDVIGHQWWWEYRYHSDAEPSKIAVRTANELHVPVGREVRLNLTSADVIHNYWPPKLAGKIYAIPGRQNHMQIRADNADFYYGECSEYCGLSHANMRLRVVSQPQAEFDRWMAAESTETPSQSYPTATATETDEVVKGATLFLQKGCSGCHAVNGIANGNVGPNLTYFNSRATFAGAIFANTDDNLKAWLRNPPAEKPGSLMPNLKLADGEINSLVAYLRTLGDASLRGTAPAPGSALAPVAP